MVSTSCGCIFFFRSTHALSVRASWSLKLYDRSDGLFTLKQLTLLTVDGKSIHFPSVFRCTFLCATSSGPAKHVRMRVLIQDKISQCIHRDIKSYLHISRSGFSFGIERITRANCVCVCIKPCRNDTQEAAWHAKGSNQCPLSEKS